jgi:hypothetical protein
MCEITLLMLYIVSSKENEKSTIYNIIEARTTPGCLRPL